MPLLRVDARPLLPLLRAELVALLTGLAGDDWARPTACPGWTVHGVAAHLLGVELGNVSGRRDRWGRGPGEGEDLDSWLNAFNQQWVEAAGRISPALLVELIHLAGARFEEYVATLDLDATGVRVPWATGSDPAPVWLDVAREYMERYVHQLQIRQATGHPPLGAAFTSPVLATAAHALPRALDLVSRPLGTVVTFTAEGEGGGSWYVVRSAGDWELEAAPVAGAAACHARTTVDGALKLYARDPSAPALTWQGDGGCGRDDGGGAGGVPAGLEKADAVATAARTSVLGTFGAGQDYADDGDYSLRSWLEHRTQVTRGAATDHTRWVKRAAAHPAVQAALADEAVSRSYAREICRWTGSMPEDARAAADEILLGAAAAGLELEDLAGLAAEMYEKSRQDKPDDDGGGDAGAAFDDRAVNLATTFGGAGVMHGDLTPECAEFVQTVLDALSASAGADDDRSHEQRYHDALQEAMRRLLAAGLLPERSGQPVRVWAHISLGDMMLIDGSSALLEEWTSELRARWAGHRAAAAEAGGHQGLWLDGDAAEAITCDAAVAPVVVGDVNPGAFDDLVRLCVQLDRLRHAIAPGTGAGHDGGDPEGPAAFGGGRSREALEQAVIGKAVELLSGPGGLASFLRRRLLGARLGGPSLPLDIGYSETVPAGIRNAVRLRGGHCEWSGGCSQAAGACQVHHTKHKANGGKTSLKDCVLLCHYHHQVMIHRLGWTLVVNPDGTTTAWNKDKTKVLHSHGPPARAG